MDIREQLFSKPLPSNRTAYKKAIKAAEEIAGMFCMSDKMLLTISYILNRCRKLHHWRYRKFYTLFRVYIW